MKIKEYEMNSHISHKLAKDLENGVIDGVVIDDPLCETNGGYIIELY